MTYLAQGTRVGIRRIGLDDRTEFLTLNRQSADLLARWMPGIPIVTDEAFEGYMARFDHPANEGFVLCRLDTGAIVGRANLNNIIRGTRQDGTLGYCAYSSTTGRGYMTEGLRLLVGYAFGELGLHRVEANIQPSNTPSLNLIKRVGFRKEGYSPGFQFIDGAWRDHERWAVTVE
ncbi:GNAT family N-acetyltransferase [Nonomuraea sp. NPDC005650]|uniref:GNAT family N-acetyltransferase n=1 Tax=Nonomuraea sp. NPDC005650 TaxID=3157045 RepID=UPI0033B628AE